MNYRHQFHAGNFADVMKHALLIALVRALQKKEKGFLYLDTHAGRGRYDLAAAAVGDSLARKPEWPDGIGRLWARGDLPEPLADYVALVREFDARGARSDGGAVPSPRGEDLPPRGEGTAPPTNQSVAPRFYPGSPWIVRMLARAQDRLALCERQPDECAALRAEFDRVARVSVHELDGYVALRGMLPPPERRALVLIDPPFEAQDEFAQVTEALGEGLRRFPSGVFAVWYPMTERARLEKFFRAVATLQPPPTLVAELMIAAETSALKMKGCGLLVLNPPWQFDRAAAPAMRFLGEALAQEAGALGRVEWLVREP